MNAKEFINRSGLVCLFISSLSCTIWDNKRFALENCAESYLREKPKEFHSYNRDTRQLMLRSLLDLITRPWKTIANVDCGLVQASMRIISLRSNEYYLLLHILSTQPSVAFSLLEKHLIKFKFILIDNWTSYRQFLFHFEACSEMREAGDKMWGNYVSCDANDKWNRKRYLIIYPSWKVSRRSTRDEMSSR